MEVVSLRTPFLPKTIRQPLISYLVKVSKFLPDHAHTGENLINRDTKERGGRRGEEEVYDSQRGEESVKKDKTAQLM